MGDGIFDHIVMKMAVIVFLLAMEMNMQKDMLTL